LIDENLDLNILINFPLGERGCKSLFSSLTLHNIMPIVLLNNSRNIKRYAVETAIIRMGSITLVILVRYRSASKGSSQYTNNNISISIAKSNTRVKNTSSIPASVSSGVMSENIVSCVSIIFELMK
jgi:hypothetical protein